MEKLRKGMSDSSFDITELKKMGDRVRESKEMEQFEEALRKLAKDNGYEIEGESLGSEIILKKGGLEFKMKHFVAPSELGIGGYSRISKMKVYRKSEKGDNELLLNYDRDWGVANIDPEVQQEIDRVVAIFG